MNTEWKEKWLAALRSGEYDQGMCCLKSADGKFCCLGVLCDIYRPNGWSTEAGLSNSGQVTAYSFTLDDSDEPEDQVLPEKLKRLIGWKDSTKAAHDTTQTLTEMNDELNSSFEEIADFIEKYL